MKEVSRILAAAVLLSASFAAKAVVFSFSNEYTGSGGTCANTVCGSLSVTQNGDDVDFVLTANLESGEFITGIYGNWHPYVNAEDRLGITGGTTDEHSAELISTGPPMATPGPDQQSAGGGEDFDWRFDFSPAPPRFDGNETFTWTFTDVDINDIIGAGSVDAGYTFVLRVQGLGQDNEGSGWFYATREPNGNGRVAEPMTLALVAFGMLALGAVRRPRSITRRERRFRLQ